MVPIERLVSRAAQHRRATGRPLVTLTYAQSLDGSISTRRGVPLKISGPEAQRFTHRLRSAHAAILVGSGTLLADDPRLTVRDVRGEDPQPVVLDGRLRFPPDARMLRNPKKPWIFTRQPVDEARREALEAAGAQVYVLPASNDGLLELPALLDCLGGKLEVDSLMVEGGARVITSFLSARLADQVVLTVSPLFIGGLQSVERLPHPQVAAPDGAESFPRLREVGVRQYGDDLVIWGSLSWEGE